MKLSEIIREQVVVSEFHTRRRGDLVTVWFEHRGRRYEMHGDTHDQAFSKLKDRIRESWPDIKIAHRFNMKGTVSR